jgi:hypothetical protein
LRGLEPHSARRLSRHAPEICACVRGRDASCIGAPNEQATIAIEDNLFAVLDLEYIATEPYHHWDAQRAGNDCRVGSNASPRERNSIGAQAQVGDIRGTEGSGHENTA